jgi:HAAS
MPASDEVDRFLRDVDRGLPLPPDDRRRVVEELRAHLEDAIADEVRGGASPDEGVRRALTRLGDPRSISEQYASRPVILDGLAALGALACATVAAWLFVVAASMISTADPDRAGFWALVAFGFLGFAVLTAAYLAVGRSVRSGGLAMGLVALVAIVAGARFAIPMLTTTGDFEGYILLMGMLLMGQGAVVIADIAARRRRPGISRPG